MGWVIWVVDDEEGVEGGEDAEFKMNRGERGLGRRGEGEGGILEI